MPTLASITRVPGDFYSTSHNSTFEHIVNKVERACFLRAHVGTWSLITICLTKAENRDILIMDGILPSLLAFPPHPAPVTPLSDAEYDKQAKNIVQILSYTGSKSLINGVSGGGDLLEVSEILTQLPQFPHSKARTQRRLTQLVNVSDTQSINE